MTTTASPVQELSARFAEPDWLRTARETAWTTFESIPTPWLEKTDLSKRNWNLSAGATAAGAAAEVDALVADLEGPVVYLVDGCVKTVKLPQALQDQGVVFTDIHTAIQKHGAIVQKHLGTVVPAGENKWSALNQAVFQGGVFLYIPRGVEVEAPFQFVATASVPGLAAYPRILIVAEEQSACTFVELNVAPQGSAGNSVRSYVAEIVANASSRVKFAAVDDFVKGPTQFVTRRARAGKDAFVEWVVSDVGDGFTVQLVESVLEGAGANSQTRVLGLGYGRQHMDLTASVVHKGRNTESEINMYGVLRDRANSVYRSRTEIVKGAVGAGSEQRDRMMMFDTTARADAIPMLLIDENDVMRCGHAASVGKLDENQIYYLMSRGIRRTQAQLMIIWGYLQDTVNALPTEAAQTAIVKRIERELSR